MSHVLTYPLFYSLSIADLENELRRLRPNRASISQQFANLVKDSKSLEKQAQDRDSELSKLRTQFLAAKREFEASRQEAEEVDDDDDDEAERLNYDATQRDFDTEKETFAADVSKKQSEINVIKEKQQEVAAQVKPFQQLVDRVTEEAGSNNERMQVIIDEEKEIVAQIIEKEAKRDKVAANIAEKEEKMAIWEEETNEMRAAAEALIKAAQDLSGVADMPESLRSVSDYEKSIKTAEKREAMMKNDERLKNTARVREDYNAAMLKFQAAITNIKQQELNLAQLREDHERRITLYNQVSNLRFVGCR
jgi:chromosome segregation ATPase